MPIIVAGLRIATVTTMGLVTIATLIGMGGLGYLIVNIGIKRRFPTATLVGVALVVLLSVDHRRRCSCSASGASRRGRRRGEPEAAVR